MGPDAKRSKVDDGAFVLRKLKGRIELRIEGISEFLKKKKDRLSESVRIRGLDWDLFARPFSGPNNGIKFFIKCNGGSRGLDCSRKASVILLCTSGGEEFKLSREDDIKYDETSTNRWIFTVSTKRYNID